MKLLSPLTLIAFLAMAQAPLTATAQESSTENVASVTFLSPGFSYELKTARYQTLRMHAFMNIAAAFSYSSSNGDETRFYFDPAIDLQYRFYYNFEKRLDRHRNVEKNSANFFAVSSGAVFSKMRMDTDYFEETSRRPIYHVAGLWGMQRNMSGRLSVNFNVGVGYRWASSTFPYSEGRVGTEQSGKIFIPFDMGLGLWLGRKK